LFYEDLDEAASSALFESFAGYDAGRASREDGGGAGGGFDEDAGGERGVGLPRERPRGHEGDQKRRGGSPGAWPRVYPVNPQISP